MAEVVAFPRQPEAVWFCRCGCETHILHADGHSECASCGTTARGEDGSWRRHLPSPPADLPDPEPGSMRVTNIIDINGFGAAIQSMLRRAKEGGTAIAAVIDMDGKVTVWCRGGIDDGWLERRLDDIRDCVLRD